MTHLNAAGDDAVSVPAMRRLALTLFGPIASTFAGVGVVIALVSGASGLVPLLAAAIVGAVIALPVTWIVAKRIMG